MEGEAKARATPAGDATSGADRARPIAPYVVASDELADYLALLKLKLRRAVERFRRRRGDVSGAAGLVVLDGEIDQFLVENAPLAERSDLAAPIALQEATIRARAAATVGRLPQRELAVRFGLSEREIAVCVLCVAPEIFREFGRVYAFLQDSVSRTQPTLALALDVLAESTSERLALRAELCGESPLFARRLIVSHGEAPHVEQALEPAGALLAYLVGGTPSALVADRIDDAPPLEAVVLAPSTKEELQRAGLLSPRSDAPVLALFAGPRACGKRTTAAAIARRSGLVGYSRRLQANAVADGALDEWLRDVLLADGVPIVELAPGAPSDSELLSARLSSWAFRLAFIVVEAAAKESAPLDVRVVEFAPLGARERTMAWRQSLANEGLAFDEDRLHAVASLFPLEAGQVHAAARRAAQELRELDPARDELDADVWNRACRAQGQHRLDRLAERVATVHSWEDLVLPPDHQEQLREIGAAAERRERVLEEWRFGEKVCVTPGVSALFCGPSGTGKTMAAGVLARHLGMDLYRIDLSRVVSKYIGETEKNLDALFEQARRAYAVLFFDEADALFGKRSEVKDAHDRYANIEVAYLLQRMESYEGLTVLATNLRNNLDEAFLRRLQFCVEFPHPSVAERRAIWRKVWPEAAPLDGGLDLEFLAQALELTGGQIRNIALKAAYLAASASSAIGMPHVIAAIRREHQKIGRVTVDRLFGPYAHLFAALERA